MAWRALKIRVVAKTRQRMKRMSNERASDGDWICPCLRRHRLGSADWLDWERGPFVPGAFAK